MPSLRTSEKRSSLLWGKSHLETKDQRATVVKREIRVLLAPQAHRERQERKAPKGTPDLQGHRVSVERKESLVIRDLWEIRVQLAHKVSGVLLESKGLKVRKESPGCRGKKVRMQSSPLN